jgi:uncharacterized membrane protein YgcG
MKFLRTLLTDLRERQILPAVVLLAVLAVAIPIGASILLSKVSAPAPVSIIEPRVVLPKGVVAPSKELAALTTVTPVSSITRRGSEPNPFREGGGSSGGSTPAGSTPAKAATTTKAKSTTTTTTPAKTTPAKTTPAKTTPAKTTPAKTKPATGSTTPSGSSGGSGITPATTTPTTGPASLKSTQAYSVNIDTKDANGLHVLTDVVRLAPLPAAESPELIYLGVLQGGKKAAFLFTNSVKVSNQTGSQLTCLPSADDCQLVELSPGQGMKLAPTSNAALITTFSFELMSIGVIDYSSADAAQQARDAVSTAGQTLLPLSNSTERQTLRFDDKIGALVHQNAPSSPSAGATGSSGSSGSTAATGSSGSTGATGGSSGNAERFPNGVAFVLSPLR